MTCLKENVSKKQKTSLCRVFEYPSGRGLKILQILQIIQILQHILHHCLLWLGWMGGLVTQTKDAFSSLTFCSFVSDILSPCLANCQKKEGKQETQEEERERAGDKQQQQQHIYI